MPPITEERLMEAFGLTGAKAQEPADPAPEVKPAETGEGAQEQEPAAPAEGSASQGPTTDPEPTAEKVESVQPDEPGADDEGAGKPQLSPEERRANAARRRQQEQQAAVDQAVKAALEAERKKNATELENFFNRMGVKNNVTGEPIKTMEQFREWQMSYQAQQLEEDLQKGKLTPQQLNDLISAHPVVAQAQVVIDQAAQTQRQQQEEADRTRINAEMARIAELDPTIQSVKDLLSMPEASEFQEFVNKGYSFIDAFRLAAFERISNARAEAAKQQAINNARGKDHLQPVGAARGSGTPAIPPEQMQMFRSVNPKATEAEIRAYWTKYQSTKK